MGLQSIYRCTRYVCPCQGNLRGELGLFFTSVLTLWSSGHIGGHVWRRVIVLSDLARSFSAICVHYRYRLIQHAIVIMYTWFSPHWKGNSCLLGGLNSEKIGRYNNSAPYVTPRWPLQGIPPLNFLASNRPRRSTVVLDYKATKQVAHLPTLLGQPAVYCEAF